MCRPISLVLLLVAIACGQGSDDQPPGASVYPPKHTPAWERDALLSRLSASERQWKASRPARYELSVQMICACLPPLPSKEFVLSVDGDAVAAVRDTAGHPLPLSAELGRYTVAGLFRQAEDLVRDSDQEVTIEYDATLGYPRRIYSMARSGAADAGTHLEVTLTPPPRSPLGQRPPAS